MILLEIFELKKIIKREKKHTYNVCYWKCENERREMYDCLFTFNLNDHTVIFDREHIGNEKVPMEIKELIVGRMLKDKDYKIRNVVRPFEIK